MQPLIVTARLVNGFVTSDQWSPALDGVLAYGVLYEQLGPDAFALGQSGHGERIEATNLPLGRDAEGDLWWWQASAPIYVVAAKERHYLHRRFDVHLAVQYLAPTGRAHEVLETQAGPLKNYRVPLMVTIPQDYTVRWHCVGDREAIERSLQFCEAIGKHRNVGYGAVQQWRVAPGDDQSRLLARFHRPLPETFAARHGIEGPRLRWGVRPPGRDRDKQAICIMP